MATSVTRTRSPRSPLFVFAMAILFVHVATIVLVLLKDRRDAAREPGAKGSDGPAERSFPPLPWAQPADEPPAPTPEPRPGVLLPAPEVLSAPPAVQAEAVAPLPADPEDRADALAAIRQRRTAAMLQQRLRRGDDRE